MKSKVITPIIVTVAIVGFIAWKLVENKQILDRNAELSLTVNTVVPVAVEKPKYTQLNQKISVNGRVEAKNEVTIYSKAHAVVLKKHKKTGDAVSKGTVIAQLENNVISENLRLAGLDFAKAEKDVKRFENLVSIGAITLRELEDAQIALRNIEGRIAELKDQLGNTTIVSPVSGIINKDYFEEGTLLTVGSSIADIVDGNTLKMVVNVTEKEMLRLHKGDKATIVTDVYPGSTFTGTIEAISPKSNDLYYYAVELALNDSRLNPGIYATAVFDTGETSQKNPVLSRKAIVGGLKAPCVFVVRNDKAYKIPVQVGLSDGEYIEITEGISMDDIIVKSGQINLVDSSQVSILN